jgi:hypothetical protein
VEGKRHQALALAGGDDEGEGVVRHDSGYSEIDGRSRKSLLHSHREKPSVAAYDDQGVHQEYGRPDDQNGQKEQTRSVQTVALVVVAAWNPPISGRSLQYARPAKAAGPDSAGAADTGWPAGEGRRKNVGVSDRGRTIRVHTSDACTDPGRLS